MSGFRLLSCIINISVEEKSLQAKLPDINAAIVRYRSKALDALDDDQREIAAICFSAINALLPEDYRIEINTKKYDELVQAKYTITCSKCDKEHPQGNIKPYDLLLTNIEKLITDQRTISVWECPNCNATNDFLHSKKNTTEFQRPFYTKTAPDPPQKIGLHNRLGYVLRFKKWFEIFVNELEHQIGLYRADYQAQQDEAGQPGFDDDE